MGEKKVNNRHRIWDAKGERHGRDNRLAEISSRAQSQGAMRCIASPTRRGKRWVSMGSKKKELSTGIPRLFGVGRSYRAGRDGAGGTVIALLQRDVRVVRDRDGARGAVDGVVIGGGHRPFSRGQAACQGELRVAMGPVRGGLSVRRVAGPGMREEGCEVDGGGGVGVFPASATRDKSGMCAPKLRTPHGALGCTVFRRGW